MHVIEVKESIGDVIFEIRAPCDFISATPTFLCQNFVIILTTKYGQMSTLNLWF